MATTYPDFSRGSSFVEDANFVEIVYADNVPTIATEDNEAQGIQYDALRRYISSVFKSGVFTKPSYSINTGTNMLSFSEMFNAVVEGHIVKVPPVSIATGGLTLSGTRTDIIFLEVFLKEVTKDSTIKKYGFENGADVVDNKILSSLIGGETSRRVQLCSRLRCVQNANSMTNASVLAQGPNGSPQTGKTFTQSTTDDSVYYNNSVSGVKGALFAIPLMTILFDTSTYTVAGLKYATDKFGVTIGTAQPSSGWWFKEI